MNCVHAPVPSCPLSYPAVSTHMTRWCQCYSPSYTAHWAAEKPPIGSWVRLWGHGTAMGSIAVVHPIKVGAWIGIQVIYT
jgi:hypothetical protein